MSRKFKKIKPPPGEAYIFRLPSELLSEIFLAYKDHIRHRIDFSSSASNCGSTRGNIPPDNRIAQQFLILGSVCRTFRSVAWATPQLWTHIVLFLHHRSPHRDGDIERFCSELYGLEAWLARSGRHHPLQIYLEVTCADASSLVSGCRSSRPSVQEDHDLLLVVMDMIAAHCERWEEIGLCLPWSCLVRLSEILAVSTIAPRTGNVQLGTTLTLLKKVALFGRWQEYYSAIGSSRRLLSVFAESPQLEELCLSMFSKTCILAPWGQLTRYEGQGASIDDVLAVLKSTSRLVECTLTNTIDVEWSGELPLVHVPQLKSLTLIKSIVPIRYLVLPALESLVLRMDRSKAKLIDIATSEADQFTWGFRDDSECIPTLDTLSFITLMKRSRCALQSLQLCFNRITVVKLLDCLRETPQLRELKLEHAGGGTCMSQTFMERIIRQFTPQVGCATLVPLLARLEILGCSCDFSIHALVDMLWLRWAAGGGERGSLQMFLLEITDGLHSSMKSEDVLDDDRMRDMISEGMDINIRQR